MVWCIALNFATLPSLLCRSSRHGPHWFLHFLFLLTCSSGLQWGASLGSTAICTLLLLQHFLQSLSELGLQLIMGQGFWCTLCRGQTLRWGMRTTIWRWLHRMQGYTKPPDSFKDNISGKVFPSVFFLTDSGPKELAHKQNIRQHKRWRSKNDCIYFIMRRRPPRDKRHETSTVMLESGSNCQL